MKFINPFNFLMFVIIYVITAVYLRQAPHIFEGCVGWTSEDNDLPYGIVYDPVNGYIHIVAEDYSVTGRPDGKIKSWLDTPKVFRTMLHSTVGDYLDALKARDVK